MSDPVPASALPRRLARLLGVGVLLVAAAGCSGGEDPDATPSGAGSSTPDEPAIAVVSLAGETSSDSEIFGSCISPRAYPDGPTVISYGFEARADAGIAGVTLSLGDPDEGQVVDTVDPLVATLQDGDLDDVDGVFAAGNSDAIQVVGPDWRARMEVSESSPVEIFAGEVGVIGVRLPLGQGGSARWDTMTLTLADGTTSSFTGNRTNLQVFRRC